MSRERLNLTKLSEMMNTEMYVKAGCQPAFAPVKVTDIFIDDNSMMMAAVTPVGGFGEVEIELSKLASKAQAEKIGDVSGLRKKKAAELRTFRALKTEKEKRTKIASLLKVLPKDQARTVTSNWGTARVVYRSYMNEMVDAILDYKLGLDSSGDGEHDNAWVG